MTTQENRDIKLTLLTKSDKIINFLNNMDCDDFVNRHQDNFKDHYLKQPPIEVSGEVFDDLDLFDIIREKYREFFERKGINETHEWLNPSLYSNYSDYLRTEDYTYDMILFELGYIDSDDDEFIENSNDMFSDLYYETASGWAINWFIFEIVELFNETYYTLDVR